MKKLFTLFVFAVVVGFGGFLWFEQSIYRALINLKDGIETSNLERVEKHADLDALTENAMDYAQIATEEAAGNAAGGLGKVLVSGIAGLVRGGLTPQAKASMKNELRASIVEGEAFELVGDFQPEHGMDALVGIENGPSASKLVTIQGACKGTPVPITVRFDRSPDGLFGIFGTYKAMGATKESLRALAQACSKK